MALRILGRVLDCHLLAVAGLLGTVLFLAGAPSTRAQEPVVERTARELALPVPALDRLEPAVRARIRGMSSTLLQLARDESVEPSALARGLGELGHLYTDYEMWSEALVCYGGSKRLEPEEAAWSYYEATVQQRAGNLDGASTSMAEAHSLQPDAPFIALLLAEIEFERGNATEAAQIYARLTSADPGLAPAWYGLGRAAAERGDDEEAIRLLERARDLAPGPSVLHYELAMAYRRRGRLEDARSSLGRYEPRVIPFEDPYALWLLQVSRLGSYELLKALAAAPDSFSDKRLLSYALNLLSGVESVVDELTRELALVRPKDGEERSLARLHYVAAGLLMRDGRAPEAVDELENALDLDPELESARRELAPARLGLATSLFLEGRDAEARTVLEAGLRSDPSNAVIALLLVRVLAASSDAQVRDGALALSIARPLEAVFPDVLNAEAVALSHAELGRFEEAVKWQRTAVERARKAGEAVLLPEIEQRLELFENGVPWRAQDPADLIVSGQLD